MSACAPHVFTHGSSLLSQSSFPSLLPFSPRCTGRMRAHRSSWARARTTREGTLLSQPKRCFSSILKASQLSSFSSTQTNALSSAEADVVSLDGLPWRVFPPKETHERIDVLTYLLGRYPRENQSDPTESEAEVVGANAPVPRQPVVSQYPASVPMPVSSVTSSAGPRRSGPQSKRRALDALQSRRLSAATPPQRKGVVNTARSGASADGIHTSNDAHIGPLTPRREAQRLATAYRSIQALRARQEDQLEEAEARARGAVLTHPTHLFDDEAAVLHRFGMGGRTSPSGVPGFHALFRQHWSDFWVTEMVPDYEAACGGRQLSRHYCFDVPPLPLELMDSNANTGTDVKADALSHAHSEDHAASQPDHSFFQVDVAHRRSELQQEAAAILAEAQLEHHQQSGLARGLTPLGGSGSEAGPAPAQAAETKAGSTSTPSLNAVFASLSQQEAHLARKEAALQDDPHGLSTLHGHRVVSRDGSGSATPVFASTAGAYYLQCVLHKQHISHSVAMANIAQTLRIHPHAISVSGIKDFIGDTVQRVRLERVSPTAALLANRVFKKRGWRMHLSDFSYEPVPLAPGDLFGNHFKIVLRDVVADSPRDIDAAMEAFRTYGFPNYYGAQRFSWFAGREDAGFALLRHNWLVFAFRFLNYTARERTLRELLQRRHKYPHAVQDEYRRNVVRRLRLIAVEPEDLDEAPFLSCPDMHEPLTGTDGGPLNQRHELIIWQLEQAFFDLQPQSRRLTAQRLSSYLWNQVLTLRLHHFGGTDVLLGDHVLSAAVRRQMHTLFDRQALTHQYSGVVTEANKDAFTIVDVVHPGFSFDGIRLPDNPVGTYYEQVCDKYHLDWHARHASSGMRDFREPARPIVRHPIDMTYAYSPENATLTVEFALERGCYANVAVSELMKRARCAGAESIVMLPAPESTWDSLGDRDPGYVTSMQDIYEGYEDGLGFTRDVVDIDSAVESEKKVWDLEGPLFLPDKEDPFRKAHAWGQRHLLSNLERRAVDSERLKRQLFEKPLADKLTEEELRRYAGHNIPLAPNMRGKKVFFNVLRRNRRYAGAPKVVPRLRRGASLKNRNHKLPAFRTLSKNAWNVHW